MLVVTGPTAVGKTAVGLALAQLLDGEVISADSVQVYRSLDVGSDKVRFFQRKLDVWSFEWVHEDRSEPNDQTKIRKQIFHKPQK